MDIMKNERRDFNEVRPAFRLCSACTLDLNLLSKMLDPAITFQGMCALLCPPTYMWRTSIRADSGEKMLMGSVRIFQTVALGFRDRYLIHNESRDCWKCTCLLA